MGSWMGSFSNAQEAKQQHKESPTPSNRMGTTGFSWRSPQSPGTSPNPTCGVRRSAADIFRLSWPPMLKVQKPRCKVQNPKSKCGQGQKCNSPNARFDWATAQPGETKNTSQKYHPIAQGRFPNNRAPSFWAMTLGKQRFKLIHLLLEHGIQHALLMS